MDTFKFGLKYWKRNIPLSIVSQFLSFISIIADLMFPMLTGILLNYIIKGIPMQEGDGGIFSFLLTGAYGQVQSFELFYNVAITYIIFILVRITLIYGKNILNQKLGLNLETDLRYATFHKLMELDSQTVSEYNSGELLQILGGDTTMFKEMFGRIVPGIFDSIFMMGVSIYLLSTMNIWFILIPLALMVPLGMALMNFRKKARANFMKIRESHSRMNLTVQENIEAIRLVRSFTNEDLEKAKFDVSNLQVKEASIRQVWLSSKFDVLFNSIKQFAYIGTIAIGAVLVLGCTIASEVEFSGKKA